MNNLITQGLLQAVDHMQSNAKCKKKKKIYFNQSIK